MENVIKEPDESWGPIQTDYITCSLEGLVVELRLLSNFVCCRTSFVVELRLLSNFVCC
jgi:hypothetical protein